MNVVVLQDPPRGTVVTPRGGEGLGCKAAMHRSTGSHQTVFFLTGVFSSTHSSQSSGLSHRFQELVGDRLGKQKWEERGAQIYEQKFWVEIKPGMGVWSVHSFIPAGLY